MSQQALWPLLDGAKPEIQALDISKLWDLVSQPQPCEDRGCFPAWVQHGEVKEEKVHAF